MQVNVYCWDTCSVLLSVLSRIPPEKWCAFNGATPIRPRGSIAGSLRVKRGRGCARGNSPAGLPTWEFSRGITRNPLIRIQSKSSPSEILAHEKLMDFHSHIVYLLKVAAVASTAGLVTKTTRTRPGSSIVLHIYLFICLFKTKVKTFSRLDKLSLINFSKFIFWFN